MFEMDELKGNTIDIELMLTELESKCTNLVKQNKRLPSSPSSSIDPKYMAMTSSQKQRTDANALLQSLAASLQKKSNPKSSSNCFDL